MNAENLTLEIASKEEWMVPQLEVLEVKEHTLLAY